MPPVHVLVVQTEIREAAGRTIEAAISGNLHRAIALVEKAAVRSGRPDVVVLPEFFLTGMASTRPHDECMVIARTIPGPETAALGALAQRLGCYIAAAAWERDDAWPDRFFNGAFIVGPSGEVELRYRKLNEGNYHAGVTGTTPADVLDEHEAREGADALFPVLHTPLGGLACVICNDVNYPETVRQLVRRGADIVLHPTGEPNGGYLDLWQDVRVARAAENRCFWVSANHGAYRPVQTGDATRGDDVPDVLDAPLPGGVTPTAPTLGASQILGPSGELLGRLAQGEGTLDAWLDVDAARLARVDAVRTAWPTGADFDDDAARTRLADAFERAPGFPSNLLAARPLRDPAEGFRLLAEVGAAFAASPAFASAPTVPTGVLACAAPVRVLAASSTDAELATAIHDTVASWAETFAVEVSRTGASVVVLPYGWPAVVAGAHAGVDLDGAMLDPLRTLARTAGVHLATALPVRSADGRRRTALLVDPDGELVLRRATLVRTPVGYECDDDAPVAPDAATVDTPFGRVGVIVGREVLSVEAVRLHAFAGAELLLHAGLELDAAVLEQTRAIVRARSSENALWIASAHASSLDGPVPRGASLGATAVHDDAGTCLAALPAGREAAAHATFDAAALRARRRVGATNKLLQLRSSLYAPAWRSPR